MIIPRREIRERKASEKPDKAFVSYWADECAAALCPLEDIYNMFSVEILLEQNDYEHLLSKWLDRFYILIFSFFFVFCFCVFSIDLSM